jgi:hypothetical protein
MVLSRMGDEKPVILPPEKFDDLEDIERDTIPGPPPAECQEREAPSSKRTDAHRETMPAPSTSERKKSGTYLTTRNLASTIAPPSSEEIDPVKIPPLRTPKISVR